MKKNEKKNKLNKDDMLSLGREALKSHKKGNKPLQTKESEEEVECDFIITTVSKNEQGDSSVDIEFSYDNFYREQEEVLGTKVSTSADGLILSLSTFGKVDIEFIAEATGKTKKQVILDLKGSIYQNPLTWDECYFKGWETAEEYLSGNIVEKLGVAIQHNARTKGCFEENITALEKIMPPAVAFKDIYATLGSPWVPQDIVEEFVRYLLGIKYQRFIYHDKDISQWRIENKDKIARQANYTKMYYTFGTQRISALNIIERTLNMQSISVGNTINEKRVIDEKETMLACEKQELIKKEFKSWLAAWSETRKRIKEEFMERYGCIVKRRFDGSFLKLPGSNPGVALYPYQKNAVARILFSPNVLLAHEVGTGKTYVMAAAGMELKRMGISNKNLYVVPNNIVEQWFRSFRTLYPHARVLCVTPNIFTPKNRQIILSAIKDNDYDAIIMAYSCFDMIPLSYDYQIAQYRIELQNLAMLAKKHPNSRKIKASHKKVTDDYNKFKERFADYKGGVGFDQLGINTLFLDEAHNYKNLPFTTSTGGVHGINNEGSKKCLDLYDKVKCIQQANKGRGVVFATGTPITNTVADLFVIQKYLQGGMLEAMDIGNFDEWIANFAEMEMGFEIDVESCGYRLVNRFSKFHNLPELTNILSWIADFHSSSTCEGGPSQVMFEETVNKKHKELEDYIIEISKRADNVRHGRIPRTEDNMLKITTDGRKAALDLRLVEENTNFNSQCKIFKCATNVSRIYEIYHNEGGTQLVFCDTSVPKKGFNAYDELKRILVLLGVPKDDIAFIHDAKTEKERAKMLDAIKTGAIRVLIGSTWKLGVGVNVQDHLIAIHHLDVPWRPSDMTQREGRIIRQGNLNDKVFVYRYVTEGTFDAYSWQLLETKQRFINKLLEGSMTKRSGLDVGDTLLSYAEVKALAVGDPLIKKRVEKQNMLSKLITLRDRASEIKQELALQISTLPEVIERKEKAIELMQDDEIFIRNLPVSPQDLQMQQEVEERVLLALENNVLETEERKVDYYRGFDIIMPVGMLPQEPYLYLERSGRYKIDLKNLSTTLIKKFNYFISHLADKIEKAKLEVKGLKEKLYSIKIEFEKEENYGDKIEELRNEIKTIDEKLERKKRGK